MGHEGKLLSTVVIAALLAGCGSKGASASEKVGVGGVPLDKETPITSPAQMSLDEMNSQSEASVGDMLALGLVANAKNISSGIELAKNVAENVVSSRPDEGPGVSERIEETDSDESSVDNVTKLELPKNVDPRLYRVVDEENPITPDYFTENDLVNAKDYIKRAPFMTIETRIHRLAAEDFARLMDDAWNSGLSLYAKSMYRSLEAQAIALSQVNGNKKYVATPGASQHNTGLAVDFSSPRNNQAVGVGSGFEDTPEGKWLKEHAAEYGYVQSYIADSSGKVHDDKVEEPWHYVYVGPELAKLYTYLRSVGWDGSPFDLQRTMSSQASTIELSLSSLK